ncbi:hypothetical protein DTO013E5_5656 [Penicillium roqueforti]|uniref:Genomic scaffold, ProqFM164S02 n=1 Tax=Penicillium roqueforti (strain FM164) TaxID=1365484 RepID=W6QUF3_PENRF|nr:hypothetical protein LCP963914a_5732 [Penicillium roqueforti]CDM33162.1 unnamed protein product [Penicillium roqueforti FM164]KAI2696835.1 hypothetical protein CBS147372_8254 [Penicillium roqueforti]KAI2714345.1 hypothetical protein CBS147354_7514 [Penicillium roqueforti]KAI2740062.1 hypothetical protein DTO012A1_5535 [Penicillium roqueforti]
MSLGQDAPQLTPISKAPKRSFQEMFDESCCIVDPNDCGTDGIDFTEKLPDTTTFLSTPQPTDKLVETHKKLKRLAELIGEGKSLAIHTNYAKAPQKERNPIDEAKKRMRSIEIEQYNAWVAGAVMPTVDWKNSNKTVELPKAEKSHFKHQVHAIREIYPNSHITRKNAHWFIANFRYVMPLIEAVAMVRRVRWEYVCDQEGPSRIDLADQELTEMELAELETARSIIRITINTLQKRQRRLQLDATLREKHLSLETVMELTGADCEVIQKRVDRIHESAVRDKGTKCSKTKE